MSEVEIEYRSKEVDHLGRCRFFLNWTHKETGEKRSQVFFADPRQYGFDRPCKESK